MDYPELVDHHFGYLIDELGFKIISQSYHPESFGNFVVIFQRKDLRVRLFRDRLQVFVDFSLDGKKWEHKERILQKLGVSMNRYKFDGYGLQGYEIENQGRDLRAHFDLIAEHMKSKQPQV